jgi:hypothetical protein
MEVAGLFKMLVMIHQATQHDIPEDSKFAWTISVTDKLSSQSLWGETRYKDKLISAKVIPSTEIYLTGGGGGRLIDSVLLQNSARSLSRSLSGVCISMCAFSGSWDSSFSDFNGGGS